LIFKSIVVGPLKVNCFVLACENTLEGIIVDPGDNIPEIIELVLEDDIRVVEVIATHGHYDHIAHAASVVRETGAPFAIHPADRYEVENLVEIAGSIGMDADPPPRIDRFLEEGDVVKMGGEILEIVHTPGHARGNITLKWPGHAIVGDTLFAGSIGRTDLPGGDVDLLLRSIREKILILDDETRVYPGHGPFTTVGRERVSNPFLVGHTGVW
jgi:hydroxyacylglutathione hydrolase